MAAISFERMDEHRARVHVSSARHSCHPAFLRSSLHCLKEEIFKQVNIIEAAISTERRAARVLARAMGMVYAGTTPEGEEKFILTRGSVHEWA